MTQEELAYLSSLGRNTVGMLERGERQPRLDMIVRLAGALNLNPCELIEGFRWTPPSERPGKFHTS
jgi:transcriptional regulator with XRE-family HTH domain